MAGSSTPTRAVLSFEDDTRPLPSACQEQCSRLRSPISKPHHGGMPSTARERVRAELTREITDAARRQLAEVGAAALSLRAVAREVGMVSSAVYRYFPSRDDLLTRLIIDGYDDVGAAAEAADVPSAPPVERWLAVCRAVRAWARSEERRVGKG